MAGPFDWLVQIPDQPHAQPLRMSNLAAHLAYNKPQVVAGQLVMSGPTLSAQPSEADSAPPAMTGSVLLFRAGSEDEVWTLVRNNPYATEGVWDLDHAVITPFKCAVRTGL